MPKIMRGSGHYSGAIDANIDAVWAVFMDWGDISWIDNGMSAPGSVLSRSFLQEGDDPSAVPRTRVMRRAEDVVEAGLPLYNKEVLLVADKEAYRLYYDATNGFIAGVRNYLASWTLDQISDDKCGMTIQSTFDIDETGNPEEIQAWIDGVYAMIVRSLNRHFALS